jgi:4-hydroxy-tetrahydrodipicolinate synthase
MTAFGRVITAMATPFTGDGKVDWEGCERLAEWLASHGSSAIVSTGTTGESGTLTDQERVDIWRCTKDAVTIPVIAGATTNDTAHSLRLVNEAVHAGLDGILAVTPYYNRPSQQGLFSHFAEIAHQSELPVILYDIPSRTGRGIGAATILSLLEKCPTIIGLKDASGDLARAPRLMRDAPRDFTLWSGDDSLTLPFLALGAAGVISVASHWAGEEIAAMIDRFFLGDVARAARLNRVLSDSFSFESSEEYPNPTPTKAMLAAMELAGPWCRLPLEHAPEALCARAGQVRDDLASRFATVQSS